VIVKTRLIRMPGHVFANLDRQAARAAAIASGSDSAETLTSSTSWTPSCTHSTAISHFFNDIAVPSSMKFNTRSVGPTLESPILHYKAESLARGKSHEKGGKKGQ
jgi:hypothetical protein